MGNGTGLLALFFGQVCRIFRHTFLHPSKKVWSCVNSPSGTSWHYAIIWICHGTMVARRTRNLRWNLEQPHSCFHVHVLLSQCLWTSHAKIFVVEKIFDPISNGSICHRVRQKPHCHLWRCGMRLSTLF